MDDLKLHIDYEKLSKTIYGIQKSQIWYSSDNLLKIFQILAIIGAAAWAIYLYFSLEKERQQVSLQLLKTQTQQADIQSLIGKLSVEESRLRILSKTFDIDKSIKRKVSIKQELEIYDLGQYKTTSKHMYHVRYSNDFKNEGETEKEITYFFLEFFTANVSINDIDAVLEINDIDQKGPINWKFRLSRGFYYIPKWKPDILFNLSTGNIKPDRGGGGTASLNSGEASSGALELLVVGEKTDWIKIKAEVGIDGGETPENRWHMRYTKALYKAKNEPNNANSADAKSRAAD